MNRNCSKANLFNSVQLEHRPEELLQESYVKQVPTNGVMLGDWVPELHTLIVRRSINPLIVEEMRQIIVQKTHKPFHVGR